MRRLLVAALLAAATPNLALAQSNALEQGPALAPQPIQPSAIAPPTAAMPVVRVADDRVAFNTTEQWLIPYYFSQQRQKQRRAARSKRYDREMPAGMAQTPAKGDVIPRGTLAELRRLPGPLLHDLPPARPGTDRVIVGKDVLMVTANGQVLDILPNIIF